MALYILDEADLVSASKNPVIFKIYSDLGLDSSLSLFVESEFGLADWRRVYSESRTEVPLRPPVYDFAQVIDSLLAPELPTTGTAAYEAKKHCIRYFVAGAEPWSTESLDQSFAGLGTQNPITPLTAGNWYRIECDYVDNYTSGQATALIDSGVHTLTLFNGNEWVYNNRIVEVFQAIADYDTFQAGANVDGLVFDIYQIPMSEKYAAKYAFDPRDWPTRTSILPANRRILTAKPFTRKNALDQLDWIWYMPQSSPGTATIYLAFNIFYTDGFDFADNILLGTFPQYNPIAVDISDQTRDWNQYTPSKTIDYIEFTIYEDGFAAQSQTLYIYMDYECFAFKREFHYFNNLAGFDSLIAYGKGQGGANVTSQEARAYLDYNYSRPVDYRKSVHRYRENFTVNAGYRSREEREAAKAIFFSESVFIREGDLLVPVIISSPSWQDEKDGDFRYTLSFDYAYAFDNQAIRPQ